MSELTTKELFKLLAPFLAMTFLTSVMAVLLFIKYAAGSGGAVVHIDVVSFDVVRFANAQRAVASAFLKPSADQGAASELLTNLSERSRKAIEDAAGPGTLVVLKQAVVQGQTRDITEEVLKKLGLPLDVPTSDPAAYTLDVAPTNFFGQPMPKKPRPIPGEGANGAEKVLP